MQSHNNNLQGQAIHCGHSILSAAHNSMYPRRCPHHYLYTYEFHNDARLRHGTSAEDGFVYKVAIAPSSVFIHKVSVNGVLIAECREYLRDAYAVL